MSQRLDRHEKLIRQGSDLHDLREYEAAVMFFDQALVLSPGCATAIYNRANTLYMLGRDSEAEPPLRGLVAASPTQLRAACSVARPRSLILDANYLLFLVLLHGRGFSEEAFKFAEQHLRFRRRGVLSIWSADEVRTEVAGFRRQLQDQVNGRQARESADREFVEDNGEGCVAKRSRH